MDISKEPENGSHRIEKETASNLDTEEEPITDKLECQREGCREVIDNLLCQNKDPVPQVDH